MKRTILTKVLAMAALAAFLLSLAGCVETVSIRELLNRPGRWDHRTVHIGGLVRNSLGAMGDGLYSVDDGTGTIWVISTQGLPGRGNHIDVVGTVFEGAEFMGRTYAVALREVKHRTRS